MKHSISRLCVAVLGSLGAVSAAHPQVCSEKEVISYYKEYVTVPGGGVVEIATAPLSVFDGGNIDLTLNTPTCNLRFDGNSKESRTLNTGQGSLGSHSNLNCTEGNKEYLIQGNAVSRINLPPQPTYSGTKSLTANNQKIVTDPKDHGYSYDTLALQNDSGMHIKGSTKNPTYIKKLNCGGTNGSAFILDRGDYYINSLSIPQAQCNLIVNPDGDASKPVRLFVDNEFRIPSKSCVNYQNKNPDGTYEACLLLSREDKSTMSTRHPENLHIFVRQGELSTQDSVGMSGLFYIDGGFALGNGTPFAMVGAVIAKKISGQNNSNTHFYYKSVGKTGSSTTKEVVKEKKTKEQIKSGFYSLAGMAVPPLAQTGDLVYLPQQRDQDAAGNWMKAGYLWAYPLKPNGDPGTAAQWEAGARMTVEDRRNKTYTQDANGKFVLLSSVNDSQDAIKAREMIYNPDKNLQQRAKGALLGQPWFTQPVLVYKKIVVYATDDGMLYASDANDGSLKWAWFPRQLLPKATDPKDLMAYHPWGQLSATIHKGNIYILGTAMHGNLRFSLRLDENGDLAPQGNPIAPAWIDYDSANTVPNGDPDSPSFSPVYAGGAAPMEAVEDPVDGKSPAVGYIRNNQLIVRGLNGDWLNPPVSLTNPSSNLLLLNPTQYYYGDTQGNVRGAGDLLVGQPGGTGPILSINGAYLKNAENRIDFYLLVSQRDRVTAFKREALSSSWKLAWYSGKDKSYSEAVPKFSPSDSVVSAAPTINGGFVLIPLTAALSMGSGTSFSSCNTTAYTFGPLLLSNGQPRPQNFKPSDGATDANTRDSTLKIGNGLSLYNNNTVLNDTRFLLGTAGSASDPTNPDKRLGLGGVVAPRANPIGNSKPQGWRELTTHRK